MLMPSHFNHDLLVMSKRLSDAWYNAYVYIYNRPERLFELSVGHKVQIQTRISNVNV